jgi:putative sigma-54 modulation protein
VLRENNMKIKIKATNLELTPAIKDYVYTKLMMLNKYFGGISPVLCEFEVSLTTHHHLKGEIYRAEANLSFPGQMLRVEKTEKDLYKAIDKVKDHLAPMIIKYKEKKRQA